MWLINFSLSLSLGHPKKFMLNSRCIKTVLLIDACLSLDSLYVFLKLFLMFYVFL